MEEKEFYATLVQRYLNKQLSDQELELFSQLSKEGKLDEQLANAWNVEAGISEEDEQDYQRVNRPKLLWPRIAVAATILITLSTGLYFYFDTKPESEIVQYALVKQDVEPGGNKATLTLADGSKISLTDAGNGQLAEQGGVKISKSANGQLVYSVVESGQREAGYNTITTPRGGIYQVNLPDGTRVWLNAASSIKFPTTFAHLNQRKVELQGEAYFEVSRNKKQPFIVQSGKQQVEVLGTHFNINSYEDESEVKTTLLEGSVKVSAGNVILLKPGQQSTVGASQGGRVKVSPANIEQAMAWKNGFFHFEKENLHSVLRQLARWYDIEVVYQVNRADDEFMGDIPRGVKLSEVLKILEFEGTHFKIENRKLIVTK
ncbi:FecR family protein [Pedobacter steynii]|uniref:FecR protein n=1 Tax=Pedobacter steynii TaxID=430522 RepID=A0A1D7QBE5_9SPHI|nr:FecR family protein [Pedobacter steynii]AOM76018.1 hypothetical protein BFS30_01870 [Pedobacter steynii]